MAEATDTPDVVGVIGAGTMGAGIAQLAAQAGFVTRLHDAVPDALPRGISSIESGLQRSVDRGRMSSEDAATVRERVVTAASLIELRDCGLVIEAAPERLELKLDLLRNLDEVLPADCVIATNTSSLSVSEMATALEDPGRLVGLHFFNPAPVMRLAEVVAGTASRPGSVAVARALS